MSQNQASDLLDVAEEIKDLEAKIQDRKNFLDEVSECVVDIARRIGEIIEKVVIGDNIHTVREVKKFESFVIHHLSDETQFGGSIIILSYSGVAVLWFSFKSSENTEYVVLQYASSYFLDKIERVINNKEDLIREYLRNKEEKKDKTSEIKKSKAQLVQLQKEAMQLNLLPGEKINEL